ncbi:MAG: hypothetical protein RLY40_955 [Pseudomonadota bacterium]|jgi:hypothetical protein
MGLFKDLRLSYKKALKTKKAQPNLYTVKKADDLLNTENNLVLIEKIRSLIKPSSRFNYFYLAIIKKFAEFVQDIPLIKHGFFNHQINFLERGLERSSRTLSLCLEYFFPEEINFRNISDKDALWIYAIFTAALFLDIGKLAIKYSIKLYENEEKDSFKKWNPHIGAINKIYKYQIDYIKENSDNLEYAITPLLARQILDSATDINSDGEGFSWIASDSKVLETWLNLLSGKEDRIPMTSFMSMVPRAEIEIIENTRINTQVEITDPAGEAFLQWLRKELAEGKILINEKDSKINISNEKIFISSDIFREFADKNANYENPEVIRKQFINILELYQISFGELDQRYRAFGGMSGQENANIRYSAIGGISTIQKNQKNSELLVIQDPRFLNLLRLPPNVLKTLISNSNFSLNNTKNFNSFNLTT